MRLLSRFLLLSGIAVLTVLISATTAIAINVFEAIRIEPLNGTDIELEVQRHPNQISDIVCVRWGGCWFRVNSDGDVAMGTGQLNLTESSGNHQILTLDTRVPNTYSILELWSTYRPTGVWETNGQIAFGTRDANGVKHWTGFVEMMNDESGMGGGAFAVYTRTSTGEFAPNLYVAGNGEVRIPLLTLAGNAVSFGPADSCGLGKRCLVVSN